MYYKEQTVKSFDGTPIYVRESGESDKPLLLLIHGGATDSDFFVRTAEPLSRTFHVVAYDRRGYLRSGLTPTCSSPKQATRAEKAALKDIAGMHAEDAAVLIREFSSEVDRALGAYVVAHSLGGPVGMTLVERHPDLVRKLLCVEPSWQGTRTFRHGLRALFPPLLFPDERGEPAPQEMLDNVAVDSEMNPIDARLILCFKTPKEALRNAPVLFAVGEQSKGRIIYEETVALAKELDKPLLYLPGVHNTGFNLPKEFAWLCAGALLDPTV
ncbi:MAG: alpha/beta fold hydrolase [Clostridia bacterium]|nr:alpha/beta fold hydrolase [Clostridia bacterium]MBR5753855.1 alpha/beta fold hydrolase [Clostridia bacterium]